MPSCLGAIWQVRTVYHQQQNKWYPQKCLLAHFEAIRTILTIVNLLAHNNISQICYCGQISLLSAAVNRNFSYSRAPLGVTFILLAMSPCACTRKLWYSQYSHSFALSADNLHKTLRYNI